MESRSPPSRPGAPSGTLYLDAIIRDRHLLAERLKLELALRRVAQDHEARGEAQRAATLQRLTTLDRWA